MRTEPRTEIGKRNWARVPKVTPCQRARIAIYEASEAAKINTWLCFEAEYHANLAEAAELGADW